MQWSKIAVALIAAVAWLATVAMLGKLALLLAFPAVLIAAMIFL